LESHGTREHDESILAVQFSKPDAFGNQLILTLRDAVQCGSSWNELAFDLFRFSPATNRAIPILSGEHGIWFGVDDPVQVRLETDDLLMEIRDRSIDVGIHNRAHILHFNIGRDSAPVRIDPVALKPEDFVDEWLTRPWTEMESRSASDEKLKKWHDFLSGDFAAGDITLVQPCMDLPKQWLIAVDMTWLKGKQLPEPLTIYFLIQQPAQYRYRMLNISFDRQEGCPGDSGPSHDSPTLFPPTAH
jgi:hypothetical protein